MDPELDSFDLNELSAAAAVTPRTIRYYVQQGLLPSPGTRGPDTRYDRGHLDRLQLIRRLQREHLPLAEIRKRLENVDDESVRELLAASAEQTAAGSSALDYVRELLDRQAARVVTDPDPTLGLQAAASHQAPVAKSRARIRPGSMFGAVLAHMRQPPPSAEQSQNAQSSRSTRSTWERIPLAPDVELHVRRPLSREQNRQVERLLEAARDLFAEEP